MPSTNHDSIHESPHTVEHYCMTATECDIRVEAAAMRGVTAALKAVGLGDDNAAKDIKDMRALLSSWRDTKSEVWKTILHWTVTAVLAGIAFVVYHKTGEIKTP